MDWFPDRLINPALLKEPLSWAVILIFGTIWLLAYHTIIMAWLGLGGRQGSFGSPGQVASPLAGDTSVYSRPGSDALSAYRNDVSPYWTDDYEAKYAEDSLGVY